MHIEHEQGYLILAVNNGNTDYVAMAESLCRSIKKRHHQAKVCLVTDQAYDSDVFDMAKTLPFETQHKFGNDWQCWYASPFRETIKLEADMLVVSDIDHWWTMLRNRDVVISTGARDYYDRAVSSRFYRRCFDENHLPDVYNAVTYWRLSETARHFWKLVREIFCSWPIYRQLLKFAPDSPDTDLVYAVASQIMGPENVTLPFASYPKITHMKQHAIQGHSKNWTHDLVWEKLPHTLRVNTVSQWGCFHYHIKDWMAHGE